MHALHRRISTCVLLVSGIAFLLLGRQAGTCGVGLTFSTNTFAGAGEAGYAPIPPGMYARAGLAWLPGRHVEIEAYHVAQLTPDPYSQVFFGLSAAWWLLPRKEHCYLNAIVEAGLLCGLDQTRLLNLKVTPVVFGCPSFGYAERFCSVGILFDPQRRRLLWQLQGISLTLFLGERKRS